MNNIKHVSFDLWLTIINSNPKFKEFLIEFWSKELNQTQNYVKILLRNMKNYFVVLDEISGLHSNLIDQFHYLYTHSGYIKQTKQLLEEKISIIYPKIEEAFLNNLPVLYDNDTKFVLEELKNKGIKTNILSNTGIIQGKTLTTALEQLEVYELIDRTIYSDEVFLAKPDPSMFLIMADSFDCELDEILHVGDNPIADGGCIEIGIQFLQVNSNENTIKKVLEYV